MLYFVDLNVISGAAPEFKSSDISVETVLSEEGHQVGTWKSMQKSSVENEWNKFHNYPTLHCEFPTSQTKYCF